VTAGRAKPIKERPIMMRRRQAGEGLAGCMFWLALLGIVLMIGFKAAPVKINSSKLYDFMNEQAKFSARTPAATLKRRILNKARELGLPVTEKQIEVQSSSNRVRMRCRFEVPIDFYVYTYVWKFDHLVDRPVFIV
jgi:hypothetical protein